MFTIMQSQNGKWHWALERPFVGENVAAYCGTRVKVCSRMTVSYWGEKGELPVASEICKTCLAQIRKVAALMDAAGWVE